ncbi:MAG: thioredoxin family protein [Actinomycetota bacterium]
MLIAAVLVGIVALATVIGLAWRATTGRVRVAHGDAREFADGITLLQFSTEVCAPCATTHVLLQRIAAERHVSHVDIDVTHRPDIANRFNLLQSPTTLVLDAAGNIRARIGGAPRASDVRAALDLVAA